MAFAIELGAPSTDSMGVKTWRCGYLAGGSQEVTLYLRPKEYVDTPWMLRVMTRSGVHVETRYYKTRHGVKERLGRLFGVGAVIFP